MVSEPVRHRRTITYGAKLRAARAARGTRGHGRGDPRGLTPRTFWLGSGSVNWLRRIVALVLLALWVPATAHCALETVLDWAAQDHCAAACSHGVGESDLPLGDACATLEKGAIKPTVDTLLAPAPSLTVLACLAHLHASLIAEAEPLARPAWAGDHPCHWVPTRHLAVRAVAPARAPNLI